MAANGRANVRACLCGRVAPCTRPNCTACIQPEHVRVHMYKLIFYTRYRNRFVSYTQWVRFISTNSPSACSRGGGLQILASRVPMGDAFAFRAVDALCSRPVAETDEYFFQQQKLFLKFTHESKHYRLPSVPQAVQELTD